MKGSIDIDLDCDYGAATAAVRQLLSEWAAIDWFVRPSDRDAEALSTRSFQQHNAMAHALAPDLFAETVQTRVFCGGFHEFATLVNEVRAQPSAAWDWKYSALKTLSFRHSRARGWSLQEYAKRRSASRDDRRSSERELFFRVGEDVAWNNLGPRLDLKTALPTPHVGIATWYLSYACMDLVETLEWQLAEDDAHLDDNPFVPLLRCYAAGLYPFGFSPSEFVLFVFNG